MIEPLELFLAFEVFDEASFAFVPVEDGARVEVWDADPLSPDDCLAIAPLQGGRAHVSVTAEASGELWPELYVVVRRPDGTVWDSRPRFATDLTAGLIRRPATGWLGTADAPLTFRLSLDAFLQLVAFDPDTGRWVGVPAGIRVRCWEHDLGPDRLLAEASTDAEGRVHLALPVDTEREPELSFEAVLPDGPDILDLATRTLVDQSEAGVLLPRRWSSREAFALEDPARQGFWGSWVGATLGEPDRPLAFDLAGEPAGVRDGNRVRALIDGDQVLAALLQRIGEARHSLHVEVMLWFDDSFGQRVAAAILERARAGVQVRVMLDVRTTAASWALIRLQKVWIRLLRRMDPVEARHLLDRLDLAEDEERLRGDTSGLRASLEAEGVRFVDTSFPYVELDPRISALAPELYQELEGRLPFFTIGRIDHRKLVVVDGRVALLGGQNFGREYLYDRPLDPAVAAEDEAWHRWHDVFVEVEGPAVRDVQHLFRARWVAEGGDAFDEGPRVAGEGTDPEHPCFPWLPHAPNGVPVGIVETTPGASQRIREEYLGLIDGATREILIENPYLSGDEVAGRLERAVARGVRVVWIFPDHHNDSWEFLYLGRLKYGRMIRAGVEVYEYGGHMTHAKVAVVDDVAVIGSANLNHSSFYKHYEIAAVVRDASFAETLRREVFERDLARSQRIRLQDLDRLLDITAAARVYLRGVVDKLF